MKEENENAEVFSPISEEKAKAMTVEERIIAWRKALDRRDKLAAETRSLNATMKSLGNATREEWEATGTENQTVKGAGTAFLQTRATGKVLDQERAKAALLEIGWDDVFKETAVTSRVGDVARAVEAGELEPVDGVETSTFTQVAFRRSK